MDSFRSRHDCIQVFLFRVCTFVVVIAPGRENLSSSSVLKRSERKEAAPVTVRRLWAS